MCVLRPDQLVATSWTVVSSVHGIFQARTLEWFAFPTPGDLPDPGIKPTSVVSPALAGGFFLPLLHLISPLCCSLMSKI